MPSRKITQVSSQMTIAGQDVTRILLISGPKFLRWQPNLVVLVLCIDTDIFNADTRHL